MILMLVFIGQNVISLCEIIKKADTTERHKLECRQGRGEDDALKHAELLHEALEDDDDDLSVSDMPLNDSVFQQKQVTGSYGPTD